MFRRGISVGGSLMRTILDFWAICRRLRGLDTNSETREPCSVAYSYTDQRRASDIMMLESFR
jgi:hypothetical protein